jgi:hypothetical protein
MWSMHIMKTCVFLTDVIEMSQTKAYEMIQALALDRSDPRLSEGVDPIATELAAENLNLGLEEPNAGIPSSGIRFNEKVRKDVEPAEHVT